MSDREALLREAQGLRTGQRILIPGGDMPAALNGIPFTRWTGALESDWETLAGAPDPAHKMPHGVRAAIPAPVRRGLRKALGRSR